MGYNSVAHPFSVIITVDPLMEPAKKLTPKQKEAQAKQRIDTYQQRVKETFQLEPQVSITLKKQTFTLEYNNRSIKDVLKDSGFNLLADSLYASEGASQPLENPEILGSLLYRGLQAHHPELTADDVDKLFTARHYPYVTAKIREALDLFMPDMSDVERDEEPPESVVPEDPT